MIYAAVIGDMVGSRKLPDRNAVQKRFLALIEEANRIFADSIESPCTVTIGDEFQVLLHHIPTIPSVIDFISKGMAPVGIYFGIGIGTLSTEINKTMAIGMDGPAFHHARKALEQAKKKKPTVVYRSEIAGTEMVNALQYFMESCQKKHTKRQDQILQLLKTKQTQQQIAEQLQVTQQTVSDVMNKAFYREFAEAKQAVNLFLESIQQQR